MKKITDFFVALLEGIQELKRYRSFKSSGKSDRLWNS